MTRKHKKTYECRCCGSTVKSDNRPESCCSCGGEFYDEFTASGISTYAIMKEVRLFDSVKNVLQEVGWRFEDFRERLKSAAGSILRKRKSTGYGDSEKMVLDAAAYHGSLVHESAHSNPKLHEAGHSCKTEACKFCAYSGVCRL